MSDVSYNDQPIQIPSEDRFGIDPFARTLASSILKMKSPQGSVIALNGPWGSGKSSAVNLIKHHLEQPVRDEDIVIIDFACWWFRGEEALALAFFRELYAGLSPSLGEKLKQSLPKLGARLLKAGSVLGGAADLVGAGGVGGVAGNAMEWLGGLIEQDEGVEKLHAKLSASLQEQSKRFLVVIDDIDRLSPDEALLIFRLVKSVGRLPNVMYLLVYDRLLAEKIVSERFPSEGPHYLEKIVQAAFELPEPIMSDVQRHLLEQVSVICGDIPDEQVVRFLNIFYDGIADEMRTPRDVARFVNSLSVTWPAVSGDVNAADFVALEVFRLLHSDIYRAIRQNKSLLCSIELRDQANKKSVAERLDNLFFKDKELECQNRLRSLLKRIFPVLEGVWGNMTYSHDWELVWSRERRVCSIPHFDTYFRFSIGCDVLSTEELNDILSKISDIEYIKSVLRDSLTINRSNGGTKAAVILDELKVNAEKISVDDIEPLLTALFEIADEMDIDADQAKGLDFSNNAFRLHWLLRALTKERLSLVERSGIFFSACKNASLGWLADFTDSAWTDYHPTDERPPECEDKCLTTEEDAGYLRTMLADRFAMELDRDNGYSLLRHKDFSLLIYQWQQLLGEDDLRIKQWIGTLLDDDENIKLIAIAFTSYGWTQTMGDAVARRNTHINIKRLEQFIDINIFRKRIEELAVRSCFPEVNEFWDCWLKLK
ncbi:KAP family P-loop NTPase fold protein [Salmonella enterica]|uniref:KAP P-loop domain-containing protein n=1 Tax=Salmonella enterica subsp. indica serovar 6,14,25:z10:1,(2),7 str. 1121 TaxID=1173950 RepID=V1GUM7_SALER|nr:P-loop NTPase fold protein [Salmonella enterica]ESE81365.1 KAP P-loop domain-containing protein [Salmonella enterica subsp. indica serovar 6,14,25:z10:1,(2),7 str. 1121]